MGRYTYNSGAVSNAIAELNDAINSLSNVTAEIQSGINTITNANGARAIDIDCSKLLQLQTMAEDVIEEDINTIKQKVTIIEEYENAPWYKKLFNSIGMGLSKFVEGIASGIENITDGAVSIVGFVGGIFNSDFKNSVAEYVAKDHVGDWFQDQYDEGFLSGVSKYSYFSENSTAANIFKGFGTAAPYIALSMTGVGTTVEMIAAGLGGVGSGTEAGINKALMNDPNLKAGDVFNKAFGQGVWQGTKNAAMVWGMNKITQGIQASAAGKSGSVAGSADDFAKLAGDNMDDVANTAKKLFGTSDDLIAQSVNGRVQIYNASTMQVVGDVVTDGSKAVLRSFGNATDDVFTSVIASSGDRIAYNVLKNTDDVLASSFDDLASAAGGKLTTTEKVFKKTGEFGDTKVGSAINTADDFVVNTGQKAGEAIQKIPGVSTVTNKASQLWGKVTSSKLVNNKLVNGVTTAVTNTVKAHPGAAYATVGTVFALDQVDEDVINSAYREQQGAVGDVTVRELPDLTETPFPTGTATPSPGITIPGTTPPATTPPATSSPTPTPIVTTTSGGGGYYPTSTYTSTPGPTATVTVTVSQTATTPTVTTPTPTYSTPTPTYTYTSTSYNPTPTPSTGGGGYTEEGYTGEGGTEGEFDIPVDEDMSGSFTEIVGGNEYTNIPTSASPITTTTTTGTKKSIIPVIAGLGSAAVAGIGTKAFLDKKEEANEEEDFEAEEWTEEDQLDIDYSEAMEEDRDYLDPSDEFAYQEGEEEPTESYEAVNSSELASMQ